MKKYLSAFALALFVALTAFAPLYATFDGFGNKTATLEHVEACKDFGGFSICRNLVHADEAAAPEPDPAVEEPPADQFPIPEGDIAELLLKLATDWKTLGTMGILVLLTLISVQAVKQFMPDTNKYKRLITLVLAIIWSVLSGLAIPGSNWITVVTTVFISSGGAMALFEALKGAGIIKKST